jgi:TPR repeat protein
LIKARRCAAPGRVPHPARQLCRRGLGAGLGEPAADPRQLVEQALAFEHGEGVPRDPEHAAELYCDAVRLGNAEAMYNLGWMYANGRGVARDDAYAATLFEMAMFRAIPAPKRGVAWRANTPARCPTA